MNTYTINKETIHNIKGGMYETLKVIVILLAIKKEITIQDLIQVCNLAERSLSGNLSRLVKLGLLERTDTKIKTGGRIVKYKLKIGGETIDFLINSLYD